MINFGTIDIPADMPRYWLVRKKIFGRSDEREAQNFEGRSFSLGKKR
jgi:hypothetical protein